MHETSIPAGLRHAIDTATTKFSRFAMSHLVSTQADSTLLDKSWLNPDTMRICSGDWKFAFHNHYSYQVGEVMAAITIKAGADFQQFPETAKGKVDIHLYDLALTALYETEGAEVVEILQYALDNWNEEDFVRDVFYVNEALDMSYGDQCLYFVCQSSLGTDAGWKALCQKYSYMADKVDTDENQRNLMTLDEEDFIAEVMAIPSLVTEIDTYCREQAQLLIDAITPAEQCNAV